MDRELLHPGDGAACRWRREADHEASEVHRQRRRVVCGMLLAATAALAGCGSLPPRSDHMTETHRIDTEGTTLQRAVQATDPGDGRSGLLSLVDPMEAFAARAVLARAAERSLDVQYYIWRPDVTGTLLLEQLRLAAGRGVRIRLLLDDNGIAGMDPLLAALDAHDGIEVRLYNPYPQRSLKVLGYLTDFARLNRRMHNKAWIADAQVAIVGGRNIGDSYFGADVTLDFADLDVLVAGRVVGDIATSFDAFWNSPLAYPLSTLVARRPTPDSALARRLREVAAARETARYLQAVRETPLAGRITDRALPLEWAPMRLVADPPTKTEGIAAPSQWMSAALTTAIGDATRDVDLVSPYFVPGARGTAMLASHPARGVRLRVVTNSLAATDVAAVHVGYARRRVELLRAGVRLYELKPDAGQATRPRWRVGGSSAASLHGKTFALDRERAFVGSFNIDLRSVRLNTELGVLIESPALAASISDSLDRWLPANAYELRLGDGGAIEWVERAAGDEVVHRTEPRASVWRRLLVSLLSPLPIESLL